MDKPRKIPRAVIILLILIPVSVVIYTAGSVITGEIFLPAAGNSNAKLVYTNTATICLEAETAGQRIPDGIYTGKLRYDAAHDRRWDESYSRSDTSPERVFAELNTLCGIKKSAYYCVAVKDNIPVAAYWGNFPVPYDRAEELIGSYESGAPFRGFCKTYTVSGIKSIGSYPAECSENTADIPSYAAPLTVYRTDDITSAERLGFLPEWLWTINIYTVLCLICGISEGIRLLVKRIRHRKER